MLNDLIQQRPDAVTAWMNAELDAQLFLADLNNAGEVAAMAEAQTEQIDKKVLWASMYSGPEGTTKLTLDFAITDQAKVLLKNATGFLYSLPRKPAAAAEIRGDGIMPNFAADVLKARGLTAPVGVIKSQPMSAYKE